MLARSPCITVAHGTAFTVDVAFHHDLVHSDVTVFIRTIEAAFAVVDTAAHVFGCDIDRCGYGTAFTDHILLPGKFTCGFSCLHT